MNARDLVWDLAGEAETAPLTLDDLPEIPRRFMLAWLQTPREGCGHTDATLYAVAGFRRAMCAPCAVEHGLQELTTHCGRCQALTAAHDPGALYAIFAIGDGMVAVLSLCSRCMTNERNDP